MLEDLRDSAFVDAFATALTEDKPLTHPAAAEAEIACVRRAAVIREPRRTDSEHSYRRVKSVLADDVSASRRHVDIVDTGISFFITDLRSANGIEVQRRRIRGTERLSDGDHIRICFREFVFELAPSVDGGGGTR